MKRKRMSDQPPRAPNPRERTGDIVRAGEEASSSEPEAAQSDFPTPVQMVADVDALYDDVAAGSSKQGSQSKGKQIAALRSKEEPPTYSGTTATEAERTSANETESPASGATSTSASTPASTRQRVRFKPPSEIPRAYLSKLPMPVVIQGLPALRPTRQSAAEGVGPSQSAPAGTTRTDRPAPFNPFNAKREIRVSKAILLFEFLLYDKLTITVGNEWSGSYNKTMAVTLHSENDTFEYVLRFPRTSYRSRVAGWVAILTKLREFPELMAPELQTYCLDSDNPFEYPFIVLNRIKGTSLNSVLHKMDLAQKASVANQLGQYFQRLAKPRSPIAGTVLMTQADEPRDPKQAHSTSLIWRPFGRYCISSPKDDTLDDVDVSSSIFVHVKAALAAQKSGLAGWSEAHSGQIAKILDVCEEILGDPLSARRLFSSAGPSQEKQFCLWHMDLFPRNIMVDTFFDEEGEESTIMTGVIDWDDAVFAPCEIAYRAPTWLWRPEYGRKPGNLTNDEYRRMWRRIENEESLTSHSLAPLDPEHNEVYQEFMAGTGSHWQKMANDADAKILRKLLKYALRRYWNEGDGLEAQQFRAY